MSDNHAGPLGAKHSFFDKSYKILFIIYAPIAIALYIYQLAADVKTNTIILVSGGCAVMSLLLGMVILGLAALRRRELLANDMPGLPFLLRPRFFMFYLPVLLVSFGISAGYLVTKPGIHRTALGDGYRYRESTNIAILINARDPYNQLLTTSLDTMKGFGLFILNNPEQLTRYNFAFFDHKNRYDENLQKYVRDELAAGTRYFVCISSEVCEPLSQNFARLASPTQGTQRNPILISTVAASSGLLTRPGLSYRFFPRTNDMAEMLTKIVRKENFNRISWVSGGTVYGEQLTNEFRAALRAAGRDIEPGLVLRAGNTPPGWKDRVALSDLRTVRPQAVLIGHSENINLALSALPEETVLLAPVGYVEFLRPLPIELRKRRIIGLLPAYRSERLDDLSYRGSFLAFTLDKLVHTIEVAQKEHKTFHEVWMETNYPPQVAFERDGEADFKIFLRSSEFGEGVGP